MSRPPRIAIVLSVRDGARYLAESIESVLAQRGVELELHLYDNGSTDGSVEIARGHLADPRVRFTANPPGHTFPHSMNLGLAATDAELYCAWAGDDVMLPGNLGAKAGALAHTGAGLAIGGWLNDSGAGTPQPVAWPALGDVPRVLPSPSLYPLIAAANAIAMPTVVMRTNALRAVGGFDIRPELTCDWLLWLRLALRVDAIWLPQPLVIYRQHPDNGSSRAWARGTYATEVLATADQGLADERFPTVWAEHRETIRAGAAVSLADGLERHGHRTLVDSPFPAHAVLSGALGRHPANAGLRARYGAALRAAGLRAPELPAVAVAAPRWEPAAVAALVCELARLWRGGLVAGARVAVRAGDLDRAAALLEPALAPLPGLDVELVVCDGPAALLRPGAVFVAEWGAQGARQAEAAGIPAMTFGMPTPYDAAA